MQDEGGPQGVGDAHRDVDEDKRVRAASEIFPDMDDVSPYFDYATSALENLKDTAKRFDEEVRLKESTSMRSTIEDCRIWMIDRLDCIQDAPLPALSKMGKLFDRLQEAIYNAVVLPEPKQMKALRVQENSLKTGFQYLSVLVLFEALLWSMELVDEGYFGVLEDIVQRLRERRASGNEFKEAGKQVIALMDRLRGSQPRLDRKGTQALLQMNQIIEDLGVQLDLKSPHRSITQKVKSMLKPSANVPRERHHPVPAGKSAKGVLSSTDCFTTPPAPISKKEPEPEPELYNYKGQIVTRSAMELLEAEDRLASKGGLFERDGLILTASALSLLQAQEAMDRSDSAGQGEYGPDVWDPIRGQYIPKWAKKLDPADQWPLLAEDGRMPLFYEDGTKMEDWYDVDLDVVENRNLLKFGIDGVVGHPY